MADLGMWALVSGKPYHGWRRLVHSIVTPLALTIVVAKFAERIFG